MPTISFLDRLISREGHCVHRLKARDTTGRWAYYFVHVPPNKEKAFMTAVCGNGTIDLEDFGIVIASNYGEGPTAETCALLKQRFGFDV